MGQLIVQVDAFTDRPFAGNPAGVCVLAEAAEAGWMQAVAAEMNLSETAFLYPVADGYHLRCFTPGAEAPLRGHATLASAHVLWQDGSLLVEGALLCLAPASSKPSGCSRSPNHPQRLCSPA